MLDWKLMPISSFLYSMSTIFQKSKIFQKNVCFWNTFWLYQHGVKKAPWWSYSQFFWLNLILDTLYKKNCFDGKISWNWSSQSNCFSKLFPFKSLAKYFVKSINVEKQEIYSHQNIISSNQLSSFSLVKTLISRNFCSTTLNSFFFHFSMISRKKHSVIISVSSIFENFSWNWFFVELFSRDVDLTEFLQKGYTNYAMVFFRQFTC